MIWHPDIPERYRDRIVRGDLLRLLLTLPDNCIDAIVTDPPYSSGGQFRGDRTNRTTSEKYQNGGTEKVYPDFPGDTRDQRGYHYWLSLWLAECWRVAKPGAPICVFTDWRQLPLTSDVIQAAGFVWRGIAVWDKTEAARPAMGRFRAQCEYIIWGSKGSWWSDGLPESIALPGVMRQVVKSHEKGHVTAKPLSVMRWLLTCCPPGGIVLDPCAGSGTTGKAALEVGMHFIGFELEPEYRDIGHLALQSVQRGFESIREPVQLGLEG